MLPFGGASLHTHHGAVQSRFEQEITDLLNPRPVTTARIPSTTVPSFFASISSTSFDTRTSSLSFRLRIPHQSMDDRLKRAMYVDKLEISTSTTATSTRCRYRTGWGAWREFCDGMLIPPRLDPSKEGWGGAFWIFALGGIGLWLLGTLDW